MSFWNEENYKVRLVDFVERFVPHNNLIRLYKQVRLKDKKCYKTEVGLCSKPEIPEDFVVLTKEDHIQMLKDLVQSNEVAYAQGYGKGCEETAEKFAERVKMAFYYEFDELIPSIMEDKIDEICKEITEGKV